MTAPTDPEAIRTRNRAARTAADADRVGIADRLAALSWLAGRLAEWPDPWDEDGERIPATVDGGARVHPAWLATSAATSLAQLRHDWTGTLRNPEGFRRSAAGNAVEKLADLPEAPDSESGLSLLAAGVERLPPIVLAETRPDPLLPVVHSVRGAPEREAGRLAFGGILEAGDHPSGQLPLFPAPDGPRVALLELTDAHGVPTMAQGRGAPLELAVYVGACILTPYDFRDRRARLVTNVRELKAFLFGPGRWRPGATGNRPGDWQRVRDAALHASGLWLPVPHPDGAPDLWRAVAVRKIPPAEYEPGHLDREVIFDVELPPGSSDGPPMTGRNCPGCGGFPAPASRAYLAAQSVAWRPGRTRVPHPSNRRYRILDRRRLQVSRTDGGGSRPAGVRGRVGRPATEGRTAER